MTSPLPTLPATLIKAVVVHSVTYFVMGLIASTLLDYGTWFADSSLSLTMRQLNDPWVMAGPLLQPIRGVVFGTVFYLLREPFFEKRNGWLVLWLVLVGIGIVGTFGPAPGSLEGIIYTIHPLEVHLRGLPEVLLQSMFLSTILYYWINHPEKRWINWVMGVGFFLLLALPSVGLLMSVTTSP